jgi:hypothetical protein
MNISAKAHDTNSSDGLCMKLTFTRKDEAKYRRCAVCGLSNERSLILKKLHVKLKE